MATSKLHSLFDRMGMSKYATCEAGLPISTDPTIGVNRFAQVAPPVSQGHALRVMETTTAPPTAEDEQEGDWYDEGQLSNDETIPVEPDEYDLEEGLTAVDLAVRQLQNLGATEFSGHDTFSAPDSSTNYQTGESTSTNVALLGFTPEEIAAVAAAVSGRRASVVGRFTRLAFNYRPPFFGAGENVKDPLMTGTRVEKIVKRDPNTLPGPLQQWTTKEHATRGTIPAAESIGAPTMGLPPSSGGERGPIELGQGQGRIIQVEQPRNEEGELSQDPSTWSTQRITPEGELDTGPLSDEHMAIVQQEMQQRLEDFLGRTTEASEVFNKRMEPFFRPGEENISNLLAQNFWSTFDRVIYGGSKGIMPIDTGESRNMVAGIEQRKQEIAGIKAGVGTQRQMMMSDDHVENSVFAMQCDAVSALTPELWESNPKEYMNTLSLLYSGDIELMRINPMMIGSEVERHPEKGFPIGGDRPDRSSIQGDFPVDQGLSTYPPQVAKILEEYAATANANANIPETFQGWMEKNAQEARTQGVDPIKMLMQKWPMLRIGEDAMKRAALMRKQLRDVSHYRGFTSGRTRFEVPNPIAQSHEKEDYGKEENLLEALKERLLHMVDIKMGSGMENNSFDEVVKAGPGVIDEMDQTVMKVVELAGQLYSSDRFVTRDERLNATYDRGQATKMEIMLKAMLLSQNWKNFLYARLPELAEQQGIDPNVLRDKLVGGTLQPEAAVAISAGFMRVAAMADEIGNYRFSDFIESSFVV